MTILETINYLIALFFMICYSYQIFYIFIALIFKPRRYKSEKLHRFAVLISARNESSVIGQLLDSIAAQSYPSELVDVYVVADNCTDNTADIAREHGAIVYERFNKLAVGKGYAMEFLFDNLRERVGNEYYDGYFVFDADNVLDPEYITEMNHAFGTEPGQNRVLTSYRNSKNYGGSWVSAGYALWFLREAKFLNNARHILHTSCAISGTGFLVHRDLINRKNGWKYFLLTEDIEFTVDNILQGEKIGYCNAAVLYDEQPETFRQSWTQRLRWAKGYLQVFMNYGGKMIKGLFSKNRFSCFDMAMNIMPAIILSAISFVINAVCITTAIVTKDPELPRLLLSLLQSIGSAYMLMFVIGTVAGLSEWKKIHCSAPKKILSFFTFPVFMLTYIPISLAALFKKVEWKPIVHSVNVSLEDIKQAE